MQRTARRRGVFVLCPIIIRYVNIKGIEIVGRIRPNSAKLYKFIKAQLDDGILQGFSNAGFIADGVYDETAGAVRVKDFELVHAALVATPAEFYVR